MPLVRRCPTYTSPADNYQCNGKELQNEFSQYDYGARFYDAVIGRWNVVDPLADHRDWLSPYSYVQNNPLNRVDPNGKLDDYILKENGDLQLMRETDDPTDRIIESKDGKEKTNRKGELKIAIKDIQKGILKDGMNLKIQDNVIALGGKHDLKIDGVFDFAVKLAEYVGKEIKGSLHSNQGENVTHAVLGGYKINKYQGAEGSPHVTSMFK